MDNCLFKDFTVECSVSAEKIAEFEGQLPELLIDFWKKYGFGSFDNGYYRLVDPKEYSNVLVDSYLEADIAIPFMVTAFGDVFVWQKNKYIYLIRYRHGISLSVGRRFEAFFDNLKNTEFQSDFIKNNLYCEAVSKYGVPSYEECFGFFPLLSSGGLEIVENIHKVKTKEYIILNVWADGKLGVGS